MQRPEPLSSCLRFPVTSGVAMVAIVATSGWRLGIADVEPFTINALAFSTQFWRLITSIFFHVNVIHLLFNLCWLWIFGVLVERVFGRPKTLGIILLLAVGSNVAEYALFRGGVGLSGVGYGLFGLLWVLGRWDRRFWGVIDQPTVQLFVGWFFLCIVLTVANLMPVANVAHGSGAVLGVLLGWAIAARSMRQRLPRAGLLAGCLALIVVGGTVARPYVNLAGAAGEDLADQADLVLGQGNPHRAIELYHRAIAANDRKPRWWHNLGVAYVRIDRFEEARQAYQRAAELAPYDTTYRDALQSINNYFRAVEDSRLKSGAVSTEEAANH